MGLHHIAFFRGYVNGLPLRELATRYLEPGWDLLKISIGSGRVKTTLNGIRDQFFMAAPRRRKLRCRPPDFASRVRA